MNSVEDGLRRVNELADLIWQMTLQRHPKQDALKDVPAAATDGTDSDQWAEFRINATKYRSYDTRRSGRPSWTRTTGITQAAARTCDWIGYEPQHSSVAASR